MHNINKKERECTASANAQSENTHPPFHATLLKVHSALEQFSHLELTKEGLSPKVIRCCAVFLFYGHFKSGGRSLVSSVFNVGGEYSLDYKRIGCGDFSFIVGDPVKSCFEAFHQGVQDCFYLYPDDYKDLVESSVMSTKGYQRAKSFTYIGKGAKPNA